MEGLDRGAFDAVEELYRRSAEADPRARRAEVGFVVAYLEEFGFLPWRLAEWPEATYADLSKALLQFQALFGVPQTGLADAVTIKAMEAPRCGHPDVHQDRHAGPMALAAGPSLAKWSKGELLWVMTDFVSGVPPEGQLELVAAAFAAWGSVCGLQSRRAEGQETPDVVIGVGKGRRSNFDGPGGVLAWAYLPEGDDRQLHMRFDSDELWTADPAAPGVLFGLAALHEIGHLLGLSHSRVPTALMAPRYNPAVTRPQVNDDVPRAQARYGLPRGRT